MTDPGDGVEPTAPSAAESTERVGRPRWQRWAILGIAVAVQVIAIVYVVDALRSGGAGLGDHVRDLRRGWFALGVLAAGVGMWWIAFAWWRLLVDDEERVVGDGDGDGIRLPKLSTTTSWYFVGEIGKYLPGGIWPVLGRGEMARRAGVPAHAAYNSVVWSLAYLLGAGAASAGPLAPLAAPETRPWSWLGLAVPAALFAALQPKLLRTAAGAVPRLGTRIHIPTLAVSIRRLAVVSVAWLLIAAANDLLGRSLGLDHSTLRVGVAAIAAWVAGTLAIGVPGGAGVREAVFVAISGLPRGDAALLAVLSRVVFVAVDLFGFLFGLAVLAHQRRARLSAPGVTPRAQST